MSQQDRTDPKAIDTLLVKLFYRNVKSQVIEKHMFAQMKTIRMELISYERSGKLSSTQAAYDCRSSLCGENCRRKQMPATFVNMLHGDPDNEFPIARRQLTRAPRQAQVAKKRED